MTNLQLTHLRFDCTATTPIKLGGHYAGNNLRNALANVMRRAVCTENNRRTPTPEHAAICPACWLLAANLDPGTVVRAYAVAPPLPPRRQLEPGERFAFGLTLFGDGFRYLPYFVLAVTEMGLQEGVGPGRAQGWAGSRWSASRPLTPCAANPRPSSRPAIRWSRFPPATSAGRPFPP